MAKAARLASAVLPLCGVLLLGACNTASTPAAEGQSRYNRRAPLNGSTDQGIHGLVYGATEYIARTALGSTHKDSPVIVTSLVDIDDLERSSTLGRMVAKQVSGKLVRMGYNVREVNLRDTLAVREGTGELILSRNLKDLSAEADAQAVVAGTYAVGGETIAVHLDMIKADDGRILSSADFVVPMNADIRGYLGYGVRSQPISMH